MGTITAVLKEKNNADLWPNLSENDQQSPVSVDVWCFGNPSIHPDLIPVCALTPAHVYAGCRRCQYSISPS